MMLAFIDLPTPLSTWDDFKTSWESLSKSPYPNDPQVISAKRRLIQLAREKEAIEEKRRRLANATPEERAAHHEANLRLLGLPSEAPTKKTASGK